MSCPARPRLPLAPLLPHVERPDYYGTLYHQRAGTLADLLAELGRVTRREAQRWISAGALPEHRADTVAAALGMTPHLIWPEAWQALADERV
jgi:hypothetical protein